MGKEMLSEAQATGVSQGLTIGQLTQKITSKESDITDLKFQVSEKDRAIGDWAATSANVYDVSTYSGRMKKGVWYNSNRTLDQCITYNKKNAHLSEDPHNQARSNDWWKAFWLDYTDDYLKDNCQCVGSDCQDTSALGSLSSTKKVGDLKRGEWYEPKYRNNTKQCVLDSLKSQYGVHESTKDAVSSRLTDLPGLGRSQHSAKWSKMTAACTRTKGDKAGKLIDISKYKDGQFSGCSFNNESAGRKCVLEKIRKQDFPSKKDLLLEDIKSVSYFSKDYHKKAKLKKIGGA